MSDGVIIVAVVALVVVYGMMAIYYDHRFRGRTGPGGVEVESKPDKKR